MENHASKLTMTQRRWLLSVHILFSAILFGGMVGFVILSITAAATKEDGVLKACYTAMHILAKTTVRASTIGTVVTGILLSMLTQWGLLRFYWIIVKELLTVLCIGVGIIGIYLWTLNAISIVSAEGLNALQQQSFTVNSYRLWGGIIFQVLSLSAITVISVFKPWGQRKKRHQHTHNVIQKMKGEYM